MLTISFLYWICLSTIVANTFAAPSLRERRDILQQLGVNPGPHGMEAYNRAFESLQSGKPNGRYSIDPIHPGGQRDITHFGGGVSGGLPLIYNGPNKPSLAVGGAASGAVGTAYGQQYQIGPDYGVGLAARYPFGTNGAAFRFGGGASFGSSYQRPQWGVGASLNIPFGRKK